MIRTITITMIVALATPVAYSQHIGPMGHGARSMRIGRATNARVSRGRTVVPKCLRSGASTEWMGKYTVDPIIAQDKAAGVAVQWLDLSDAGTGDRGAVTGKVAQVLSDSVAHVSLKTGRYSTVRVQVSGMDFSDVVNGDEFTAGIELTGVETYATALGSTNKIRTAKVIGSDDDVLQRTGPQRSRLPYLRDWTYTDEDGHKETIEAQYYGHEMGEISLIQNSRYVFEVDLKSLSADDQKHVRGLLSDWRDASRYLRQVPLKYWPNELKAAAQ